MITLLPLIKQIISFSPRQLGGEIKTANFLKSFLRNNKIDFAEQIFEMDFPLFQKTVLLADDKSVECDGSGFVGGKILDSKTIFSSLSSFSGDQNIPNINFSHQCPAISKSVHYFAPAISVSHKSLTQILKAKKVSGYTKVKKVKHKTSNILVGNTKNPQHICFAHYDSINAGAIDNASGVAVMMGAILEQPKLLEKCLYVFSAVEELSYEKPIYWGYGYRIFEKKFKKQITQAKKLFCIDCVGTNKTQLMKNEKWMYDAFPLKNFSTISKKTCLITSGFDDLMAVYHSNLDDGRGLSEEYLREAVQVLLKQLKK